METEIQLTSGDNVVVTMTHHKYKSDGSIKKQFVTVFPAGTKFKIDTETYEFIPVDSFGQPVSPIMKSL